MLSKFSKILNIHHDELLKYYVDGVEDTIAQKQNDNVMVSTVLIMKLYSCIPIPECSSNKKHRRAPQDF